MSAHGAPLVELLDPRPGERILDLGCGTGVLTADIAARGAQVLGIDGSAAMIERAIATYPGLDFIVADGYDFMVAEPYDAVFSNAALHWLSRDPDAVIRCVRRRCGPAGGSWRRWAGRATARRSSPRCPRRGASTACASRSCRGTSPRPAEYALRLEKAGFTVRLLEYFDRPTPLDECPDGAADWVRMFAGYLLAEVPPTLVEPLLRRVNELAAPALRRESGWVADYVRLRFAAVRD